MKKIREWIEFVREAWKGMKKVTYPTRRETFATTAVAITLIFLTALFLGIVDFIISRLVKFIF